MQVAELSVIQLPVCGPFNGLNYGKVLSYPLFLNNTGMMLLLWGVFSASHAIPDDPSSWLRGHFRPHGVKFSFSWKSSGPDELTGIWQAAQEAEKQKVVCSDCEAVLYLLLLAWWQCCKAEVCLYNSDLPSEGMVEAQNHFELEQMPLLRSDFANWTFVCIPLFLMVWV